MSFLLLPQDERVLVDYLCNELDLTLLPSDVTEQGVPRTASQPLASLPDHLPSGPSNSSTLLFWCRSLGPIRTHADASEPIEAADRVANLLTREATGARYADVIDLSRTPVIRWSRSRMHNERRLIPGLLQAMPLKTSETPPEVLRLHRQIDRWMKERGEKLNPFEHCSDLPGPQPRNLSPFWVWVHPHAMEWVRGGGEIWPWTA